MKKIQILILISTFALAALGLNACGKTTTPAATGTLTINGAGA